MDGVCAKRVGISDYGANVEVMLPVLDSDVERVPFGIELLDDGVTTPVPESVLDVSPIAVFEQFWVETGIIGPRLWVRANPHLFW